MPEFKTETLLKYLALKNNNAYRHLYSVYYTALKALAEYYVKDESVAEDLVQEVFISLLESDHLFTDAAEVKYFLYSALKNRCISHFRKQKVRQQYQQEILNTQSEIEYFWDAALKEDVYASLMSAINTLPPQCKLIIQLTLEGLKISEIAAQLHISENTVKEQKSIGKKKLLRILDNPYLTLFVYFI